MTDANLQGSAGQEQAMTRVIMLRKDLRQLARVVLHAVTLIDDNVVPANLHRPIRYARMRSGQSHTDLAQHALVLHDVVVGGQHHIELAVRDASVVDDPASARLSLEHHLQTSATTPSE